MIGVPVGGVTGVFRDDVTLPVELPGDGYKMTLGGYGSLRPGRGHVRAWFCGTDFLANSEGEKRGILRRLSCIAVVLMVMLGLHGA